MEKQTWKVGNHSSTVVSDTKINNSNFPVPPNKEESTDEEIEFYGGYLVCESIGNVETANLIAAAPKMLQDRIDDRKAFADILKLMPETDEYDSGDILMQIERIVRDRLFYAIKKAEQ